MATYRFDYGPDFKKLAALTKLDSNANIDSVVSASTNLPMTYWYKNSWITSTKNIDDQSTDFRTAFDKMDDEIRSEEHTSELQSLMRISYAVFCLKKKKNKKYKYTQINSKHIHKSHNRCLPIHNQ